MQMNTYSNPVRYCYEFSVSVVVKENNYRVQTLKENSSYSFVGPFTFKIKVPLQEKRRKVVVFVVL